MARRVTVDEAKTLRVDGRPFFPIAARHLPIGASPATLVDVGFNAMRWTPFGMAMHAGDHFADRPDADGMMYYAYVFNRADFSRDRDVRRADLERLVRAVREDDRLLCYEQLNEPAWSRAHPSQPQGSPEGMAEGSAVIRELDPHHPIRIGHMCSNLVATLRRYNPACDIVSANPYVIDAPGMRRYVGQRLDNALTDHADRTLSAVGRYTDKMRRVARDTHQVWMQLQAAANENWYSPDHTPEIAGHGPYEHHRLYPTYWQMRFMAFHAIIHGARGLEWFLYQYPVTAPSWADVVKIIGELASLHDVLAAPAQPHRMAIEYEELGFSDWEGVEVLVKRAHGVTWLLAANTQFDPAIATFSQLPDGVGCRLEVFGEAREIAVESGRFADRFQPYEVHVYVARD